MKCLKLLGILLLLSSVSVFSQDVPPSLEIYEIMKKNLEQQDYVFQNLRSTIDELRINLENSSIVVANMQEQLTYLQNLTKNQSEELKNSNHLLEVRSINYTNTLASLRKTIDELESTYNGTVDKYEDQLKIEKNKTLVANMMFILLLVTFILLVVMYVLIKRKSKLPI